MEFDSIFFFDCRKKPKTDKANENQENKQKNDSSMPSNEAPQKSDSSDNEKQIENIGYLKDEKETHEVELETSMDMNDVEESNERKTEAASEVVTKMELEIKTQEVVKDYRKKWNDLLKTGMSRDEISCSFCGKVSCNLPVQVLKLLFYFIEHTCAYARWASMHHLASVHDWTKNQTRH